MWVHTKTPTWERIGDDNGLTWVYTNTHTWELIGDDNRLTWVNTNTPTWERICTVTWVYTNTLTRFRAVSEDCSKLLDTGLARLVA